MADKPPSGEYGLCRGCKARVIWIHATSGALMPLDAEPNEGGNVVIVDGKAQVLKRDDLWDSLVDGARYMPHHATCPEVKKFRKPKG